MSPFLFSHSNPEQNKINLSNHAALLVLRNPAYFFLIFICAIGAYITYQLNLWGPILKMTEAASQQALEEGKRRLREFLETSDTGRQAMAMSGAAGGGRGAEEYEMSRVNGKGGNRGSRDGDDMDDVDDL